MDIARATKGGRATWAGLALLLVAIVAGIYPLMPLAPASGPMRGVPHWPWVITLGMGALGLALMLWGRFRARP